MRAFAGALLLVVSCAPTREPGTAVIFHAAEAAEALQFALLDVDDARLSLEQTATPAAKAQGTPGLSLSLELSNQLCAECFQVARAGPRVSLQYGGTLGLQYGVTHWLEGLGFRFFHPRKLRVPAQLPAEPELEVGLFSPEIARRGLHLHTLHPIESLFDFWVPSAEHEASAVRTLQWLIRQRGNYVQWNALEDLSDPRTGPAWREHTRRLVAAAHARGVKVGLSVQLFANASLQQSYTLIDAQRPDDEAALRERLQAVAGLGLDNLNVSFGEFFAAEAGAFISRVDATSRLLGEVSPGMQMSADVHVGDTPGLRVTWQGREQLYYFLVRYVNPAVLPRVHTVMFYNLFDSAGGAYHHRDFSEHRAFIYERLEADQPVGYFPETAYWVAFDNAVPVYLPVYIASRHLDLAGLRAGASRPLQEHLIFSSGWEWGYWQNDAASLRMSYRLPARWEDAVQELVRDEGLTSLITRLGNEQRRALIVEELAAYLAGRDQLIDAGDILGIIGAPDRPDFQALGADFSPTLDKLAAHAAAVEALAVEAAALPREDAFVAELSDGVQITAARARFSWAVFAAAQAYNLGQPFRGHLDAAEAALAGAQKHVGRRRVALHWPRREELLNTAPNPSFYDYGYLRDANTLCFWRRELAQVKNLAEQAGLSVPGCVL